MRLFVFILFFITHSIFAQNENPNISRIIHSFGLTYETYMGYTIHENNSITEDKIVNTSLLEDYTNIFGFGLRYGISMPLNNNDYNSLKLLEVGAESYFDFLLDYQYTDFSREAFTYGVIPYIRFLYFLKFGYGFGYINFRESTDFYGAESTTYSLHQGIQFYHMGIDVPLKTNFTINATMDFIENNAQFLRKWEIVRFRLGITFRK
jgi:hypothetical protein